MKSIKYILILLIASTTWGCMKFVEDSLEPTSSGSNVTVLEDGRYQVTAQLNGVSMTSVVTRASVDEDAIIDGWCLVFGEDEGYFNHDANVGTGYYSDNSPLIEIEPVTINANGTFTMVFDEYPHTAFMRIVANLTERENKNFEDGLITSWRMAVNNDENEELSTADFNAPPTFEQVEKYGIATFGQYRHQSVGLDGIYNVTYDTTSTMVEYDGTGGFTDEDGNKGYKDVVDYSTPSDPVIESVVQYSVQYKTTGGKEGTSTVTGLTETYNTNSPDPANPKTTGFPMASYGFVMTSITEETLNAAFGNVVDMIRVCSKVQVEVSDSNFTMSEVYLIDAAQESRIRSSVLSNSGIGGTTTTNSSFSIPVDLGGTIDYKVLSTGTKSSDPIYFYPNSGGGYIYTDDAVDQDINPQYIIIKGQSSYYDTPGYYKVALKAQYPTNTSDGVSDLTYDILRNTSFTVKLLEIDKPGYKTFDDAADPNSPANNISYSMTIDSSDNRYEVLVSKGTYYVELETSRVYVKGYMDEGIDGCYVDFSMIPSPGNSVPTVYVQSSDHDGLANDDDVSVTHCLVMRSGEDDGYATNNWDNATKVSLSANDTEDGLGDYLVKIEDSEVATKVRVYFDANDSGRIRLRIGDMLKFIPVVYDRIPISIYGTKGQDGTDATDTGVVVTDAYGTSWSDFSYSDIDEQIIGVGDADEYSATDLTDTDGETFGLNPNGTITYSNLGNYKIKPELRARIMPTDAGDGNAVLYLRQASDFRLMNASGNIIDENGTYNVIFNSQSVVKENNTDSLFVTASDGKSIIFDASSTGSIETESVDAVTIEIDTDIKTTKPTSGVGSEVVWENYFNSVFTNDNQTLTLSADIIDYDLSSTLDLSNVSDSNKGATREAWITANVVPKLITYENEAVSTITVTNVAGDYKKFVVNQTQYPPVYIIDASGETIKSFSIYDILGHRLTDGACVFAVSLWNYTDCKIDYSYSCDDEYYSALYKYRVTRMIMEPYVFDSGYSYNWSSDSGNSSITYNNIRSSSYTVTPVEIWKVGGYQTSDAVVGVIRNEDYTGTNSPTISGTVYMTIYIEDKYEDIYSTTKILYGSNNF